MKSRSFVFGLCILATANAAGAWEGAADDRTTSFPGRYVSEAQELVVRALSHVGVGYRRGGESPETGFDCSGLVRHVFREVLGLMLPRTSHDISRVGEAVQRAELQPGDLVFFNTRKRVYSHVGIYLGEHRFVHAPAAGGEVRIEDMRQRYWSQRFNGARRIAALDFQSASN